MAIRAENQVGNSATDVYNEILILYPMRVSSNDQLRTSVLSHFLLCHAINHTKLYQLSIVKYHSAIVSSVKDKGCVGLNNNCTL